MEGRYSYTHVLTQSLQQYQLETNQELTSHTDHIHTHSPCHVQHVTRLGNNTTKLYTLHAVQQHLDYQHIAN